MLVHSGVCGEAATLRALSEQGLNPSVTLRHTGAPGRLMRQRRLIEGQEEMVFVRAAA